MNDLENHETVNQSPTRHPYKPWLWLGATLLILGGLALAILGFWRPYTLVVDGQSYQTKALVFRAGTLLKQAGLSLGGDDKVSTDLNTFSLNIPEIIHVTRARQVEILSASKIQQLNTTKTFPIDLINEAGFQFFPNDLILQNGEVIDPYKALPLGQEAVLEYYPAKVIHLDDHGKSRTFSSQKDTLAEAFAEKGITIEPHDRLSMPLETQLASTNEVAIQRAHRVVAYMGDLSFSSFSAAESAEEALLDIGMPLQNLNVIAPQTSSDDPSQLTEETIKVVQVTEAYQWVKEETPYNNTYDLDPNAELDTTSVLVPGQTGYVVTRSITRLEDGIESMTYPSQHWKASDAKDGVLGRGTMPVVKTEVVDGVTIEYWRKVSVYATSYHPAEFGGDARTASGLPLTKGIVAVSLAWYRSGMNGQRVFIPNYGHGIIADNGGGIPGRYWIDLGYDDENYVGWHHWTTLYFLTPIPSYIPAVLP